MGLKLEEDKINGLTESEAEKRIRNEGYNEISGHKQQSIFLTIFNILKEPMFLLLIACGIIYLFLGDIKEAIMLLFFVFVIIGINIYQENKTEKTLEALRDLSSPRAVVIRDGEKKRIAGREVVRGDILMLSEGERVPADAIILSCSNLQVDESLLTGESVPVRKSETKELSKIGAPGGEDIPFLYSGTLVVSGTCIAEAIGVGMNTEIGKIGKSLETLKPEKTSLQKEVSHLVKYFAISALIICAIVVMIYGLTRKSWIQAALTGITLAMSILPEEFPVILAIFLALGAWRLSRKKVLARKQNAVQALGSATVLCVDKTGTLTQNKMSIKTIYSKGKFLDITKKRIDRNFYDLIETGVLASQQDPFDPMEKSLKNLGKEIGHDKKYEGSWKLVKDFPLTKKMLAISEIWESEKGNYIIASKGAPEAIADLCHLDQRKKIELFKKVEIMAAKGLRVIAVAKGEPKKISKDPEAHDFDFNFLGLIGFEDPVRPGVANAIKECYSAGIKVIMITGDYPITAKNIGLQIGFKNCDWMTGQELDHINDDELRKRISNVCIFARVVPEQKLRIVEALKSNGEIVVMTGDGVNDAPALKSANIGIAMGLRGTDVAREASGLVILDDDFSSIVAGVRTGRRIFDNIRKAMGYTLAVHLPIVGITLLALIFGWPLILFPAHIVFLELIIDPACSIVFEAEKEEENIMRRKPRNPKDKIFNKRTVVLSLLQGIFVLILVALVFKGALYINKSDAEARAISFSTLILCNIGLILSNLSWKKSVLSNLNTENKALLYVALGAITLLLLTVYFPFLRGLFLFEVFGYKEWGVVLLASLLTMLCFEVFKRITRID
jgi:P-type Ca2+ transporter type 2C